MIKFHIVQPVRRNAFFQHRRAAPISTLPFLGHGKKNAPFRIVQDNQKRIGHCPVAELGYARRMQRRAKRNVNDGQTGKVALIIHFGRKMGLFGIQQIGAASFLDIFRKEPTVGPCKRLRFSEKRLGDPLPHVTRVRALKP